MFTLYLRYNIVMDLKDMLKKWKSLIHIMNMKGIPVPTMRDPKTGTGSVSFTMVCISFGLMGICTLLALTMVINKWAGFFVASDMSLSLVKEAFSMALQMSGISVSLYWGRKFQVGGATAPEEPTPQPKADDPDAK